MELKKEDFTPVGLSAGESETLAGKPMTYLQDAWRRFKKNRLALTAAILLLLIVLFTLLAPLLSPYDFAAKDIQSRNQSPASSTGSARTPWAGTCSSGWPWAAGCPSPSASAAR